MIRPKIRSHFHVEIVEDDDVVYLMSETNSFYLKGALYCLLVPYLDGTSTEAEIVERLSILYSEQQIGIALAALESKGFIEDTFPANDPKRAAFWNSLGVDTNDALGKIRGSGVRIESLGDVDCREISEMLKAEGLSQAKDARLTLLLTDDYLRPEIAAFNEESLDMGRVWLLAKPLGGVLWLGPLFIPGKTGCWECLAYRLRDNRDLETLLSRQLQRDHPFPVSKRMIAPVESAYVNIIATHTLRAAVEPEASPLISRVMTFDMGRLDAATHVLTRRPQCPRCGSTGVMKKRPVHLESRIKKFTQDGGHRVCGPTETLENCKDMISPITGVVGGLKTAFHDPSGLIDIYAGVHRVQVNPGFSGILASFQNNSTGKGRSHLQSKASAFAEAVERYCAAYREVVPDLRQSISKMAEPYIDLNECMLFSQAQYRERSDWNEGQFFLEYVPVPLSPEKEIDWTRVWSMSENTFKYVPTAYCYLGYSDPEDEGEPYYNVESNGLAAGNVLEEAILQAFMEVMERDALSVWWYNRIKRPAVDLDSFKDPYFDALREYYANEGRDIWVLDLTHDAGIPVYAAVSAKRGTKEQAILLGAGAHFDPFIGVSRALTEMNQGLYVLERDRIGKKVDGTRIDLIERWFMEETLEGNDYLVPDSGLPETTAETHPYIFRKDIRDDIERCLEIIEKMGLELLVHDLSLPDVAMNVVKVIVPGLRQIRPRYAPGRLYDVPVKMGWLSKPREESELNPQGWLL